MRFTILLLVFVFCCFHLAAQHTNTIARAEHLLKQINSDTPSIASAQYWEIDGLDELYQAIAKSDAKKYGDAYADAYKLYLQSIDFNNPSLADSAFNMLIASGKEALAFSAPTTAVLLFKEAETIAFNLNSSSKKVIALNQSAKALAKSYKPEQGIQKLLTAITISEQLKDHKSLTNTLISLGELYKAMEDFERALLYLNKGKDFARQNKDDALLSDALTNIGRVYLKQSKDSAAYYTLLKAAALDKQLKNWLRLAETEMNLASISFHLFEDLTTALTHARATSALVSQLKAEVITDDMMDAIIRITGTFRELNQTKSADIILKLFENYCFHVVPNKFNLAKVYQQLAMNSAYRKEYQDAYGYINKYHYLNNSIIEMEKNRAVKLLEIEYETQKKELTIAQQQKDLAISKLFGAEKQKALALSQAETQQKELALQRKQNELIAEQLAKAETEKQLSLTETKRLQSLAENQAQRTRMIYIIIAAILILSISTAIYFIRQKQTKLQYQLKALESKMVASKSQMDAHFTSNAFATLQNQINQNPEQAEIYTRHLATFIRNSLDQSDLLEISLQQEINALINYLQLEQIRLEDKFDYNINVATNIQPATIKVPALILQPIAENTIIHGFSNITYQGQLTIDINLENNQLQYIITDNGVGRKIKPDNPIARKSKGTKITTERLHDFAQLLNKKSTFLITDLPQGVQVKIKFPLVIFQEA